MRDRGGSHALDVLSAAEDPTSLKFEPRKYLSKVHKETSLDDLKRGMSNLQKRIDDQKDQRMLLVKENFDRCAILPIPCHPPPCSTLSLSLSLIQTSNDRWPTDVTFRCRFLPVLSPQVHQV